MLSLSELLKNHPIPGIRQSEIRRVCAQTIETIIGVPVLPAKIRLQNGVLSLSIPPVTKSALLIRKSELCTALKEQNIQVSEIR